MRFALIILIAVFISGLSGAEIIKGRLQLEMLITESGIITISNTDSMGNEIAGQLTLIDADGFSTDVYSNKLVLELVNEKSELVWGILNRAQRFDPTLEDKSEDLNLRNRFAWENGKLTIIREKLVFEDKYFNTRSDAEKYAQETGYPIKQVQSIPMHNARMRAVSDKGKINYLQLPVEIRCASSISFNENEIKYHNTRFWVKQVKDILQVTNLVALESYLCDVVPYEIGHEAPTEALKAQAVAARTHSVSLLLMNRHLDDGYDLCQGTHCQVYKPGLPVPERIISAVTDTEGLVMIYEDRIADGVYHSCCGGKTENNQSAWNGKPIPYLQGVACCSELEELDLTSETNAVQQLETQTDTTGMTSWEKRSASWERTISRQSLASDLKVKNLHAMKILRRGNSGRILKLKLIGSNEVTIEGEYKIRQALGGLPSSFFYVKNGRKTSATTYSLPEKITVKGKGFGHGVGLCQVGALRKARSGWLWQDILTTYYPGVAISGDWLDQQSGK